MKRAVVWGGVLAFVLGLLAVPSTLRASGFALLEQSGKGLGEAFTGGITDIKEASSIFYNPSAMAFMEHNSASAGLSLIDISAKFRDRGSTTATGMALSGGDGGDAGEAALIPNLYCVREIKDGVKLGLGINSPFGLATNYDADWKGRYHAVKSDLLTVGISPAVAVRLNEYLPEGIREYLPEMSAGVGLNVQYADAELTNAIDFGTILASRGVPATPQSLDGFAALEGDDWGFGYSLGLLCRVSPTTRIGLNYRSKVDHKLSGDVEFRVPATARAILNAVGMSQVFIDTDASARLTTPESIILGVHQDLGEDWAVMADIAWTRWSRFDELRVDFDSNQPDAVTEQNWNDTLRYALGVNYLLDEEWTLRAGTAYDNSPIDTEYRTPRIPGNDRIWLTLGAGYRLSDTLSADLSYGHLFVADPRSDLRNDPLKGYLVGEYETSTDMYAFQVSYKF